MGSTEDGPLVSVIVPTYGRQRSLLREAIESVAKQTYAPVELVIVDDSPNGVESTIDDAATGLYRVRVLRDGEHDGAGDARNTGIEAATGTYLAFLDDDDEWLPDKLTRQVTMARDDPRIGLVVTGQRHLRDGIPAGRRVPEVEGEVTEQLLRGARLCPFSSAMVRASVIPDAGNIDERLPVWEDIEWYVRLSRHCLVGTIDELLVHRRMGDHEQLTDDFESLRDHAYPLFRRKHRSLAAEYSSDCERRFVASLTANVAFAALASGRYADTRTFALCAIRADPSFARSYLLLVLGIGGSPAYRSARWLYRRFRRPRE